MELDTNRIFNYSLLKKIPKTKYIEHHKPKLNSAIINKIKNRKKKVNSKSKQKISKNSTIKNNPFSQLSDESKKVKNSKIRKMSNLKKPMTKIDKIEKKNLLEDSYLNNIMLTNESDTIDNIDNNKQNDNKNINQNKNELNFEELYNIYKKSNLKSTIIIDNNGNNNLDKEQEEIINGYFNKRKTMDNNYKNPNSSRIKKNPNQIYKNNISLFIKINHLKRISIMINKKNNNFNRKIKNIKQNFNKKKLNNKSLNIRRNLIEDKNKIYIYNNPKKSTNINEYMLINNNQMNDDKFIILKEKDNNNIETEKNSVFENISLDLSFLSSSLDDDFIQSLNKN